jgi:hypothetical protein
VSVAAGVRTGVAKSQARSHRQRRRQCSIRYALRIERSCSGRNREYCSAFQGFKLATRIPDLIPLPLWEGLGERAD